MNEQEAQQAQTIAEIRERLENPEKHNDSGQTYEDALFLMDEVDSQAQKINQLESELRAAKSALEVAAELLPKRRKEIAEQAKEIERLKFKVTATELRCANG